MAIIPHGTAMKIDYADDDDQQQDGNDVDLGSVDRYRIVQQKIADTFHRQRGLMVEGASEPSIQRNEGAKTKLVGSADVLAHPSKTGPAPAPGAASSTSSMIQAFAAFENKTPERRSVVRNSAMMRLD